MKRKYLTKDGFFICPKCGDKICSTKVKMFPVLYTKKEIEEMAHSQAVSEVAVSEIDSVAKYEGLHFFLGDGFFARGIDRNLIRVKK